MASTKSERKPHVKTRPAEIVSVDEAVDLHRGDWIVMRVTRFDEKHEPLAGVVFAHSKSHNRVCNALAKAFRASPAQQRDSFYYLFLGEPAGHSGTDLQKQLEELAAKEEYSSAWRP